MGFESLSKDERIALARKGGRASRPSEKTGPKEFCRHGHKLEGDNLWVRERKFKRFLADGTETIYKHTTYVCHQCVLDTDRRRREKKRDVVRHARIERLAKVKTRQECIHGHPQTPENIGRYKVTRVGKDGEKIVTTATRCLACVRESDRRRRARARTLRR